MNAVVELPVEQRHAQLDRGPLPDKGAPEAGDQEATPSGAGLNNQAPPAPNVQPGSPELNS